jgi:cysteinyl-tRNA synthetase
MQETWLGGDRHEGGFSTANRIIQNKKYLALDIPVFSVDYCISESNADQVYRDSRNNGFIPLVTRVPLSEITETPPF